MIDTGETCLILFEYRDGMSQMSDSSRYVLLTLTYYWTANSNDTTKNTPSHHHIKINTKMYIFCLISNITDNKLTSITMRVTTGRSPLLSIVSQKHQYLFSSIPPGSDDCVVSVCSTRVVNFMMDF